MITEESGIYQIVNLVNGKVYVGSASNIRMRWNLHKSQLRRGKHHSIKLQRSWSKHGEECFQFEVLEITGISELIQREQFWMDAKKAYIEGYNSSREAGRITIIFTAETLAKRSASLRGLKRTPETKARMSAARKGIPMSEAQKKKLSDALKGRPRPPHLVQATAAANRGKKAKPHVIEAMQAGRRAKPLSEETRKRMSDAQRARHKRDGMHPTFLANQKKKRTTE